MLTQQADPKKATRANDARQPIEYSVPRCEPNVASFFWQAPLIRYPAAAIRPRISVHLRPTPTTDLKTRHEDTAFGATPQTQRYLERKFDAQTERATTDSKATGYFDFDARYLVRS